ncbi:hypothetical protein ACHHYP_11183 [Achlya hypogyna]|uniref:AAA+ ATPase domain-containing protein n=1 Tax=Achlya hypogyna TaxID=1202772 RepID=A0A1V9YJN7_ACHHY|nr:hypothetical protein ACHHYP_11183 [Achlya hypogyna]
MASIHAHGSPCYVSSFAISTKDLTSSQRRQATTRIVEILKRDKTLVFKVDTIGREYFLPRPPKVPPQPRKAAPPLSPVTPPLPPVAPRLPFTPPPTPPPSANAMLSAMYAQKIPGSYVLVPTQTHLKSLVSSTTASLDVGAIGLDVLGPDTATAVVQLAIETTVYFVDCAAISPQLVWAELRPILQNPFVSKVVFDGYAIAKMLAGFAQSRTNPVTPVLDLQLAAEALDLGVNCSFNDLLNHLSLPTLPTDDLHQRARQALASRPLEKELLVSATWQGLLLHKAYTATTTALADRVPHLEGASDARLTTAFTSDIRQLGFLHHQIASFERIGWATDNGIAVHENMDDIVRMLPTAWGDLLCTEDIQPHVLDIDLDLGRRPWASVAGQRLFLDTDEAVVVTPADVARVVDAVGGFGSDNRAGIERQLHRVSALRNRESAIVGVTIRVGRHVEGNARLLADVLGDVTKNVLFLGEPGCGKTTIIREVAQHLAATFNVCIVDTSNEIAGDGDVPHPCVGLARRIMVPSLAKQAAVMVECVQNHAPEVMVIDEIGRPNEVEAARTCKQRGVRMIASAHGSLRKLLKNQPLRGLVGGVTSVTVGDALARKGADGNLLKIVAERSGESIFDVIVELRRQRYNSWHVVLDAEAAVDAVLAGGSYTVQVRTRTPGSAAFSMHLEKG